MASENEIEGKAKDLAADAWNSYAKYGNPEEAALQAQLALTYATIDIANQLRSIRHTLAGIREDRHTT